MTNHDGPMESLTQRRVLFCRETLWDEVGKLSTNYYAQEFARDGWQVFWLTRPLSPASFLSRRWAGAKRAKLGLWRSGGASSSSNVVSYAPLTILPYRKYWMLDSTWVARSSLKLTIPPLRSVLERHSFESPEILWLSDMSQASILQVVEPGRVVLHVTDDYTTLPGAPRSLPDVERELQERADTIIVTHPQLLENSRGRGRPVHYLPQGVDADRFLTEQPFPLEYESVPAPRAAYVGSLPEWIDWDLILEVIEAAQETSFVFIGSMTASSERARRAFATLIAMNNAHWLGVREDVVPYLQHADVGLIPFQTRDRIRRQNTMKLFEYVAAGLPVVSTWPFWDIVGLKTDVPMRVAARPAEFSDAVSQLGRRNRRQRAGDKDAGRAFAQENSWRARYESALLAIYGDTS